MFSKVIKVRLIALSALLQALVILPVSTLASQNDLRFGKGFDDKSDKKYIRKPVFNCTDTQASNEYVNYESGQVRPLALSPDNRLLFVANTPANCLEIYALGKGKPKRISAIQVGLEPVAVAVRNQNEIWVVNHLSDSVSIVDISGTPHVRRTLQVGDEPRDIVFAGRRVQRAFVTTAHRGQNHPGFTLEDLRTPGIGRADVWVYDANDTDRPAYRQAIQPINILSLFTDTPRALAVSADKKTVYAAGFLSGNQTTSLNELNNINNQQPAPVADIDGVTSPRQGLIVQFDGQKWRDDVGGDWSDQVWFSLPDEDVFEIDAEAKKPKLVRSFSKVGTVLYNMTVNPATGSVYVTNTEANNLLRFEGSGTRATSLRGRFVENRITVIRNKKVVPIDLNAHIDLSLPMGASTPPEQKNKTLAQPMEIAITRDGKYAYVVAFGSNKVAVIPTEQLEQNRYQADESQHISVPGGPSAIVLDNDNSHAYVYSRYDNVVSVIERKAGAVVDTVALYNPEPEFVIKGRPLLYDAMLTSSNGTASCGSCHVFGDLDGLAWDLGDPDSGLSINPLQPSAANFEPLSGFFHPLKGPMVTQTFRGIADSGPMHWRGDRTGINTEMANGVLETQAAAAFKEFNKAFVRLNGRGSEVSAQEMQAFTDFSLSIQLPPNPIRNLDNSLTEAQARGGKEFFTGFSDSGFLHCSDCHVVNKAKRQFGTDGTIVALQSLGVITQEFKIPHLRNMYQKVGMFGGPVFQLGGEPAFYGDQIRGFGFLHDGSVATIDDFMLGTHIFEFDKESDAYDVGDYLMVFDTNQPPITGQQVTLSPYSGEEDYRHYRLLRQRAEAGDCRLETHGTLYGKTINNNVGNGVMSLINNNPKKRPPFWLEKNRDTAITVTCKPVVSSSDLF